MSIPSSARDDALPPRRRVCVGRTRNSRAPPAAETPIEQSALPNEAVRGASGRFAEGTLGTPGCGPLTLEAGQLGRNLTVEQVVDYVTRNHRRLARLVHAHGAVRLPGVPLRSAADLEAIATAFCGQLADSYVGTTPRRSLEVLDRPMRRRSSMTARSSHPGSQGTKHVFSAAEIPSLYPIPQHCEMAYLAHPPRYLIFGCAVRPAEPRVPRLVTPAHPTPSARPASGAAAGRRRCATTARSTRTCRAGSETGSTLRGSDCSATTCRSVHGTRA